ncbi:MAG TPA: HD domain-containing protein [Acidobacteriota bacterium]|nr:HD domain-containing protein [Acidobacteriota bacterium]
MSILYTPLEKEFLDNLTKPRSGWVNRGVPPEIAETVQTHTYKVIAAASIFANSHRHYDRALLIDFAKVHDFPERQAPDFTPSDQISPARKYEIEDRALQSMTMHRGEEGARIYRLWKRFEAQDTLEAMIVKDLDKIDPAIQSIVYARMRYEVDDFIPYTRNHIQHRFLKKLFDKVVENPGTNPYKTYFQALRSA